MISQAKNSKESVSPKDGLSVKRSVRLLAAAGLTALAVFFAGCKNSDPFVNPGDTPNPQWGITVENDMTSSMTAIVKVSFAQYEGVLAAFIGNDCCGIGEYIDGLYWLYVSPVSNDEGQTTNDIQLRFYSPDLKRIFDATSTVPFHNDTQLGSIAEPYTPEWKVAK